ncbi:MAG: hypothetical protein KC800_27930 [Candidatus Eremiobacteraeota bacterium]|nr:hypothetical protein [Candidatus Eremiobacteraeota bacterium]
MISKPFYQYRGILMLALSVLFFVSCGSSSNDTVVNNLNDQQYRYLGANTFNNGQNGTLDFSVFGNGSATGSFQVANDVSAQTVSTPGSYPVTGTASLASGAFTLSGSIPGFGDFIITGVLPQGNAQASYTITFNNSSFQGILQTASLGVPAVPGNGGGTSGDSNLIAGGTVNNLEFQFSNDYNGDNPPVDNQSIISGAFGEGADGQQSLTITLSETVAIGPPTEINLLTVTIVDPNGADLVVNQAYQVLVNDTDAGSFATLTEASGTTTEKGWVTVGATSTGTATITSLTDTQVTVEFNFDNLVVNPEVTDNMATGAFDLIGSITGNFAATP